MVVTIDTINNEIINVSFDTIEQAEEYLKKFFCKKSIVETPEGEPLN